MPHKPADVLSVPADPVHRTVIDLIDDTDKHTLHPSGRPGRTTSGLVLLTNDDRWQARAWMARSRKGEPRLVQW